MNTEGKRQSMCESIRGDNANLYLLHFSYYTEKYTIDKRK